MQRENINGRIKSAVVDKFNLINDAQLFEKIEEAIMSYYDISLESLSHIKDDDCNYDAYVYVYLDPTITGRWHIYGDECVEHKPLYVGKGTGDRSTSHLTYSRNSELDGSIKTLQEKGIAPIIKLYNKGCTTAMAFNLENYIIARLRDQGVKLCNATPQSDVRKYNRELIVHTLNLDKLESFMILDALNSTKSKGVRKEAASLLGVSERTLYRKIKSLNIVEVAGTYHFADNVAQILNGTEVDSTTENE